MLVRATALVCLIAGAAAADVSREDAARATALFDAGQTAVAAGRIDEGCERFQQSLALDPQLGTRMNLADCREKQGRLVEAYQLYDYSAAEAEQLNKPGRLTYARQQQERLAKSLVRITLKVTDDSPGLTLQLSTSAGTTRELPRPGWSKTVIVEPGSFSIDASAPDRKPIRVERDGAAGSLVEIEIPQLESTLPPPPPPPPPPKRSRAPYLVGGVGVVLVGVGVALILTADSATDARGLIGIGAGVVGAGTIGCAVHLYLKSKRTVAITPTASPTTAGVALVGSF